MQNNLVEIIGAVVMCGGLWLAVRHASRKSRIDIEQWAKENNFKVANLRWGPPWRAPFEKLPPRSLQSRATFRAELISATGEKKNAWIAYHTADNDSLFTKDHQLPKVVVMFENG